MEVTHFMSDPSSGKLGMLNSDDTDGEKDMERFIP